MTLRVYIDRFTSDGPIWSVDAGSIATEERFAAVEFIHASGTTHFDMDADN